MTHIIVTGDLYPDDVGLRGVAGGGDDGPQALLHYRERHLPAAAVVRGVVVERVNISRNSNISKSVMKKKSTS